MKLLRRVFLVFVLIAVVVALPFSLIGRSEAPDAPLSKAIVGTELATKQAADGSYITWVEHRIDDQGLSGLELRGADGLAVGDIDKDGFDDVIAVHEDSNHVRISFGTEDPNRWFHTTLADDLDAFGAEDVAVGDLNGDGWLDLVIAAEVSHLLYLENPGSASVRNGSQWQRLMPSFTRRKGSWVTANIADINGDGKLDVLATNKGLRQDTLGRQEKVGWGKIWQMLRSEPIPVAWTEIAGEPLDDESWKQHIVSSWRVPINAEAVDLDQDGDLDIIGGSRGGPYLVWLENTGGGNFERHDIKISNWTKTAGAAGLPLMTGIHMAFHDMDGDGKLDILARISLTTLGWLKQPETPDGEWHTEIIARYKPDHIFGFTLADIDGDGDKDIFTGTYSKGSREQDTAEERLSNALGRLTWLENPGSLDQPWPMHDLVRRQRGMFDEFVATDRDGDGDIDIIGTRGNSGKYDGVFWLEQKRLERPATVWTPAIPNESQRYPLAGAH